jgi:hypothetical protein
VLARLGPVDIGLRVIGSHPQQKPILLIVTPDSGLKIPTRRTGGFFS